MRIQIIAVGDRMPAWVEAGVLDYQRRLSGTLRLEWRPIAPARAALRPAPERVRADEATRILRAIPDRARVVALDERGEPWSTRELAHHIETWMQQSPEVVWLVGGAEGLAPECLARADAHWSLSRLTLPHALVRVLLAEQLYRAETLLKGHPYHRD
jgi:23S rRNA (pseudouridine1915-N3)-methyltransferase